MSAIKNHYHDEICQFDPGPDPELPGWDRYANSHMPILAGEAAVMRSRPVMSWKPIAWALIPSLIGWAFIIGIGWAVVGAVSGLLK